MFRNTLRDYLKKSHNEKQQYNYGYDKMKNTLVVCLDEAIQKGDSFIWKI